MYKCILIFAAHPDDEITMGGTIAKLASGGAEVIVVQMTDGCEGYKKPEDKSRIVKIRKKEAHNCDRILGIKKRVFLNYPDMSGTYDRESYQKCIQLIRKYRPEAIFTHGPGALNRDHIAVYKNTREAIWQASEPVSGALGQPHLTKAVYFYKDYAQRGPFVVLDVSNFAEKRVQAYESQKSQRDLVRKSYREAKSGALLVKETGEKYFERFELAYFYHFHNFINL
ncbi:Mycothiol S-conjugate amidase [subsurface metagenome]